MISIVSDIDRSVGSLIQAGDICVDVGVGIRPQNLRRFKWRHICVEPQTECVEWLRLRCFEVVHDTIQNAVAYLPEADTIFMLDVIEILDESDGTQVLAWARAMARHQIVISSPLGYRRLDTINRWLVRHSGWRPEMFAAAGWTQETVIAPEGKHFCTVLTRA